MDAKSMSPMERRFLGTVRLATLHLWRVAKSTDLEECFAKAASLGMLGPHDEEFARECLAIGEQLERGDGPTIEVTQAMVDKLQGCVLKLNSADPA